MATDNGQEVDESRAGRKSSSSPRRASPSSRSGAKKGGGCLFKTAAILSTLVVVILAVMVITGRRSVPITLPEPDINHPLQADSLIPAFRVDPEACAKTYVGRRFTVAGKVKGVRPREQGGVTLLIRSDNGDIAFEFPVAVATVVDLCERDEVVVSGLCRGVTPGNSIAMEDANLLALLEMADRDTARPATLADQERRYMERLRVKMRVLELVARDPRFARARNSFNLEMAEPGSKHDFHFTLSYFRRPANMQQVENHSLGIIDCCRKALREHSLDPNELGITITATAVHVPPGLTRSEREMYGVAEHAPGQHIATFTKP